MIIILKKDAAESQVNGLLALLESKNIQPHVSRGSLQTIVGCVGDVSHLDPGILEALRRKGRRREFLGDRGTVQCRIRGSDRRYRQGR